MLAKSSERSGKKHAARSSSSLKQLKKYCIHFSAILTVFQRFLDEFQHFKKCSGIIRARETQKLKELAQKCSPKPPADPPGRVWKISYIRKHIKFSPKFVAMTVYLLVYYFPDVYLCVTMKTRVYAKICLFVSLSKIKTSICSSPQRPECSTDEHG